MRVSQIMVKSPVTVPPGALVKAVSRLMLDKAISSVIVTENHKPIGIITERDLVRRVLAPGRNPETTKAMDICSKPVIAISEFTDVGDAVDTMTEYKIRRLVVVDRQDKVSGILTTDDIGYELKSLSEELALKYMILSRRKEQ